MTPETLHKDQKFFSRNKRNLLWANRRLLMASVMVLSDCLCLSGSMGLATILWSNVRSDLPVDVYLSINLPIAGIFLVIYLLTGLYPGIGIGPVEELRRLTISTSLGTLVLMGLTFYLRNITSWSRAVLGLTWLFLLVSVPLMRKVFRRLAVRIGLWGIPVVIVGEGGGAERIYTSLSRNRLIGFWPVLCIKTPSIREVFPPPSYQQPNPWEGKDLFQDIDIAIIVPQKAPLGAVKNVILDRTHKFKRVIVMFDEARFGSVWFTPLHLVEQLGLEVTHQLIDPTQQAIKRILDVVLIILAIPILLPIFLLVALAIKLDSPGPVFYAQKRIGHNGREIRMWKFRSMIMNAESVLKTYLEQDDELRAEWEQNFKLKRDMRITKVGNFLRRTSLDELPQLWNVINREMSLIGPRPIVKEEIPLYKDDFEIYKQVMPGMTGMWQISGRNNLSYGERVGLDVYYVQNWSIWLDIHILMHTILAALQGHGAY
jgi:Undecaprenyl-phosphate galactose phosphotransferase WbaP